MGQASRLLAKLRIGHTSDLIDKYKHPKGHTHRWTVFVHSSKNESFKDKSYIEKVVFNLHPDFVNPKRVVRSPPFEVTETGYGGFVMPVQIYFTGNKSYKVDYELNLSLDEKSTSTTPFVIEIKDFTDEFFKLAMENGAESRSVQEKKSASPVEGRARGLSCNLSPPTDEENRMSSGEKKREKYKNGDKKRKKDKKSEYHEEKFKEGKKWKKARLEEKDPKEDIISVGTMDGGLKTEKKLNHLTPSSLTSSSSEKRERDISMSPMPHLTPHSPSRFSLSNTSLYTDPDRTPPAISPSVVTDIGTLRRKLDNLRDVDKLYEVSVLLLQVDSSSHLSLSRQSLSYDLSSLDARQLAQLDSIITC